MVFFSESSQRRPEDLPQSRYEPGNTLSNILQIKAYVAEFVFRKLLGEQVLSSLWVLLTQKTSLSGGQMPEFGNGVLHHYRPPRHINEQSQIIFLLLCVSHWESGTLWKKILWILFYMILLQNVCVAPEVVSEVWKQLSKNRPIPWHGRKVLLELWNAGRHFSRNILWALQLFLSNVYMWTETSHYTLQYTQLCLVYCCKANMEFHRP